MGLVCATISAIAGKMCLGSSSPPLFPLALKGWQGYPLERMKGLSRINFLGSLAISFTSLAIGIPGNLTLNNRLTFSSKSQNNTGSDSSAARKPRANPPMPLHKSTWVLT